MPEIPEGLRDVLARFGVSAAVDILIVSGSIYWLLLLVRGTTAMTVLRGVGVLLIGAFLLSRIFDLRVINWILRNSLTGLLVGMLIVFQPEIRRALERLGRTGLQSVLRREARQDTLNMLVRAAFGLARQNTGALIVIERETGLQEVIDTGVPVNASLSVELLMSIFPETGPLHDGAVVVRGGTIVAAGCTLPLSDSPLPAEFGMRHRAAVGMTERTDAVVIVVSEERGSVSLSSNGRMVPNLDDNRLSRQLHRLFDLEFQDPLSTIPGARLVSGSRFGDGGRAEAIELAKDAWRRSSASVRRTPGLLLLSFLLGISLWVFVTDTENPTVVEFFPQPIQVESVNVSESLAVANQFPAVSIRVLAPTDRWEQLTAANFRAFVDLDGFQARSQEVPIQVEVTGVSGVRVVDTDPRTITVNLEDLVSKQVPVNARVIGSLPIGYELGGMTPQQSEVTVTGPESLVERVSEAAADVNVTGLTVGLEQTVPLKPLGAAGSEIRGVSLDPVTLSVSLEVTQSTIVRTVPLTVGVVGTPASGFRVSSVSTSPAAIQIQGPIELLQQVDAIALPAVNLNAARSDIVRSVAIPLPNGLSFVDTERATVTVTIAALTSDLSITAAIRVEGLGPDLQSTLEPANAVVVVNGPLPVLNALAAGEIVVQVDVSGLAAGTYSLPVEVEVPGGVVVASVQPENVTVTISSP